MNVLVTGGTGFIGSHVTRILLERGHKAVCYDLLPDVNLLDRVLDPIARGEVTVIRGDASDPVDVMRALSEHRIDTVIHQAGLLTDTSDADPRLALRVNCESLINMLEAARILALRRIVWASSVSVFGRQSLRVDEKLTDNAVHRPIQVYGATKSLNEFMAKHYFDRFGVDSIGLRYTIVYGLGRMRGESAFASRLLASAALGKPTVVPYANAVMDWQHVEDAAAVTVAAAEKEGTTRTRTFNTGGILASSGEVAEIIHEVLPDIELTLQSGFLPGGELPPYDVTGSEIELGFRPKYDLRAGVIKTINDYRAEAGLKPV